ncbi:MAG TPA: PEP-CTERM sorting domain-containing protein [Bryobacteraceae bacterium]|nr:PEP-CTERM sorting domain-containing protein [Bryobacteraceae bacterium]
MKTLLPALAFLALSAPVFGSTVTLTCTASGGTSTLGDTAFFNNGMGTASFVCSDASLGSIVLTAESVNISSDYTNGNGLRTDPSDNSAGFTFSNSATTWGIAMAGATTTTMSLSSAPGVTLFTIGNKNSSASTINNTTSGGLSGTVYTPPTVDAVTGALLDTFTITVNAFVDAGGFTSGLSDASVDVTFSYNAVVNSVPEPVSMALVGGGLLALALIGRRRVARK